jgi:hypothetical protein
VSYIVLEFDCEQHGRFESLELRAETTPEAAPCPECGALAPWVISAPMARTPIATVHRGASEAMPPNALDTRPLAEGMSHSEWTRQRRQKRREERLMRLPPNVRRAVEKRQ